MSYNKGGGSPSNAARIETAMCYFGETMTITATPNDGYKFSGWFLSSDLGTGPFIKVSEGNNLSLILDWAFWAKYGNGNKNTENVQYNSTLYARWEKIETAA